MALSDGDPHATVHQRFAGWPEIFFEWITQSPFNLHDNIPDLRPVFMWRLLDAIYEKVPNVFSRCHTKRRMGAHGSFGMTPPFFGNFWRPYAKKSLGKSIQKRAHPFFFFLFERSVSYQKAPIQAIRYLFAWCSPYYVLHVAGPGEQGAAVILSAEEEKKKDSLYKVNGFNAYASDKISLDRALKDIRHPE